MATPLSQRLANFRQNFKKVLGPKRQGYGELSQLEQPLVGEDEGDQGTPSRVDYARRHGVSPPSQRTEYGTQGGLVTGSAADVPSQVGVLVATVSLRRGLHLVGSGLILASHDLDVRSNGGQASPTLRPSLQRVRYMNLP